MKRTAIVCLVLAALAGYLATLRVRGKAAQATALSDAAVERDSTASGKGVQLLASLREPLPSIPSNVGKTLIVNVYTKEGPLEGASVEVQGAMSPTPERTDRSGRAALPLVDGDESGYRAVRVSASRYGSKTISALKGDTEVHVLLLPPCSVAGRVVSTSGSPPDVDMTVLAWPVSAGKDLPASAVFSIIRDGHSAGGDGILYSRAAADGAFAIEGLENGLRYFFAAGGLGWASLVETLTLPRPDPLLLTAQRVFGAALQLCDDQGQAMELSPTLARSTYSLWGSHDPAAVVCDSRELAAALSGLSPEECANTPSRFTCMYLSDSLLDRVGPCEAKFTVSGYRSEPVEFYPTSTTLGMMEIPVELIPSSREAPGAIELVVSNVSVGVMGSFRDAARLVRGTDNFVLELTANSGPPLIFGFDLDAEEPMLVTDVPAGEYSYRLRSLTRLISSSDEGEADSTVRVVSRQTTRIELDAADWGTLTLRFLASDGSEYRGPAEFSIAPGQPPIDGKLRGVRRMTFDHGPYVVGILRSGAYSVRVWKPGIMAARDQHGVLQVNVEPGECNVLRLELTD